MEEEKKEKGTAIQYSIWGMPNFSSEEEILNNNYCLKVDCIKHPCLLLKLEIKNNEINGKFYLSPRGKVMHKWRGEDDTCSVCFMTKESDIDDIFNQEDLVKKFGKTSVFLYPNKPFISPL